MNAQDRWGGKERDLSGRESWTCSCGGMTVTESRGSQYGYSIVECPHCHERAEILPLPPPRTTDG